MGNAGESAGLDTGHLVVRSSGAAAFGAAAAGKPATPENIQLVLHCVVDVAGSCRRFGDTTLHVQPSDRLIMMTVPAARLALSFAQLRPLMFRPVPVDARLVRMFSGAVKDILDTESTLDRHGVGYLLRGFAELILRTALKSELDRADAMTARRAHAERVMAEQLADPGLTAERVAEALFISRRRLYQLFADGDGVLGRIRTLRIERAKSLLADPAGGDRPISDIARECGFVSAAHFSRTFRKLVGKAPKDYRADAVGSAVN